MAPRPVPVMARIERRLLIDLDTGCWLFQGAHNGVGYGAVGSGGKFGPRVLVHRVVYEALVEPIPEGLVLDHLCRNTMCCNPGHLEPVTSRENVRRGRRGVLYTTCPKGHELTPDNTSIVSRGHGQKKRRCRTCLLAERRRMDRARRARANTEWGVG